MKTNYSLRGPGLLLLSLLTFTAGAQTVPQYLNYQGKVTDSTGTGLGTGTPVNRKILFRVYDLSTAGTKLWSEEQTVTIANGEFSVLLGAGIAATYNAVPETALHTAGLLESTFTSAGTGRYLGVTVDNGDNTFNTSDVEITPRQQITTAAYAFHARSADSIAGSSDLTINPTAAALTGGSLAANYGLGWYGTGRPFSGVSVDGPVVYGFGGGALGSANGAAQNVALRWNAAGQVGLGIAGDSLAGVPTSKLVLQGDDATATPQQLLIRGNAATTKQLLMGYNTTSNYGSIQAKNGASMATGLVLNPIGGNVGIGTASGVATLAVVNASGASSVDIGDLTTTGATGLRIATSAYGGGYSSLQSYKSQNIEYGDLILQPISNNVGIGTTSPAQKLHLSGGRLRITDSDGASQAAVMELNSGANTNFVYTSTAGNLVLDAGARNVGIGTTSPNSKLHIGGSANYFQNPVLNVQTATAKATAVTTNAFVVSSSDSANPFGVSFRVIGSATPANRTLVLQTGDLDASDSGNLVFQPGGGNVGIGTSSPSARLDISGFGNTAIAAGKFFDGIGAGVAAYVASTQPLSIRASNRIAAEVFLAVSDARIKNIEGRSDSAADLRKLLDIEVTDYRYKDVVSKGDRPQKKVIAQQVEKIYPQAVNTMTDSVPDIYRKAKCQDGWVQIATDLKKGERVKLITLKGTESVHEVLEATKDKFRTDLKPEGDQVFVFGREVNDFRTVDYEAISMLNVSATQQIKKEKDAEVKALQDENAGLRTKLAAQDQRLAALEAKDKTRDARLVAIEKLLSNDAAKTEARTVLLKKSNRAE